MDFETMNDLLRGYKTMKKGFSIFTQQDTEGILKHPLFKIAKGSYPDLDIKKNEAAARMLIEEIWTDAKTEELKKALSKYKDVLFISVPGTSRRNMLPVVFAEFLAELTKHNFLVGDEHIDALHKDMMKNIKNGRRLFHPRRYHMEKYFFNSIKELKPDCPIIIVEDILTTGSSANTFARFLKKNGLNVQGIFAIKGNPDISPTRKGLISLQRAADDAGLDMNLIDLGKELTATEAMTLASTWIGEIYNKKANEKEKRLMKKQIQLLCEIKTDNYTDKTLRNMSRINRVLESLQKGEKENEPNKEANEEPKEESETSNPNGEGLSGLKRRLVEDSAREGNQGGSASSTGNEPNVASLRVRDDKDSGPSVEVKAASEKPSSWKIGKSALLRIFLGKSNE